MLIISRYYQTAAQVDDLTATALTSGGAGPAASNILLNGTNQAANGAGSYLKVKVTAGKRHLLRLINTSVDNALRVSMDGHNLTIITSDFVPVQPIVVESVMVNIGQRYEVIIDANQTPGTFVRSFSALIKSILMQIIRQLLAPRRARSPRLLLLQ